MRRLTVIGVAGAIALTVASCASDSGTDTTASSPSPAPLAQKPATSQPFNAAKPLVAQKPPAGGTIPGLIQSTNGDERAKQVQASIDGEKGKDPFAGLPPQLPPPKTATTRTTVPSVPKLPTAPKPKGSAPFRPSTPLPPQSSPTSNGPTIAALPPLPSANLANAVEITGVVRVGGVVQAIVKAPNEETSRYVRVGQRLSNGQVLVKRIEMNTGSDPVVILEENGVEVARTVGEGAPPQNGRQA